MKNIDIDLIYEMSTKVRENCKYYQTDLAYDTFDIAQNWDCKTPLIWLTRTHGTRLVGLAPKNNLDLALTVLDFYENHCQDENLHYYKIENNELMEITYNHAILIANENYTN